MTRRIDEVDLAAVVSEIHNGAGYGDSALLFKLHPVGGGKFLASLCFHGSGHLNGSAVKQQLLRGRRFTGIGVGDDGKRSSLGDFFVCDQVAHFLAQFLVAFDGWPCHLSQQLQAFAEGDSF